jgi:hypothetical protein
MVYLSLHLRLPFIMYLIATTKRTDTRQKAWLTEALWRHNHKPVADDKSPFEAFFALPAKASSLAWLEKILPRPHTTFT